MCGIAGLLHFDGQPLDAAELERMIATLAHRGPDGRGIERFDGPGCSGGFGHTRLKVIDLSDSAAQPMVNEDRSVFLVFNGEIYNYRELRAQLSARGAAFRSASDTEVILRAYELDGERCVERFDGMFALAIWDQRRRQLLLARDRVGKKPLFYVAGDGWVAFASEAKALLACSRMDAQVDTQQLPAFFLYGYVPTPFTFYRGMRKLPPGHWLRVGPEAQVSVEPYWDLPTSSSAPAPSPAQAAGRVRELVTEAVRRRLIADVPLGAFLSGGVDSTIVVGLMSRLQAEPVRTFSIGFSGDARFDETAYARLAAERFHTKHTEFIVRPSAIEVLERLVRHHDGPFADSSAIPTYYLARLTREHVTVALNGDGGDELFAGYLRFYAAVLCERVPHPVRRALGACFGALPQWGGHRSLLQRARKFAGSAALPLTERYTRWISVFYEDLERLLPGAAPGRLLADALACQQPLWRSRADASALSRLLYVNLKTYLLDDLLVKMDRCTMAHGLEARSPFLDRALLEYVFSLPDAMKLQWGRTKVVLRRAFADLLPAPIMRRGKMGFGVPLQRWLATDLRPLVEDLLMSPTARLRRYVDQAYVRELWQAHQAGRADHSHQLWTLLTFECWLRQLPQGPRRALADAHAHGAVRL